MLLPPIDHLFLCFLLHFTGSLEEFKSVLAGGSCQGWLPDVSVILWKRMLGALGDVNKIEDPLIHASVFEHLCDLQETLIRVRNEIQLTLILLEAKVFTLCHYRARPACISVQSGQSVLLSDSLHVLILISLKMIKDSSKN